ncbi:PhnE/PtxC family ABC transporter permease [Atopomonas sediminilitoris]|uniref:PhnE/PtxC family ABC transporter permease n=1 Tax=Atopomonas sediminilitoris TaxID=2919919 RepID=UPI001F4D67EF|nr:ABC transporter permease subunit [Atopomonas sediminilitoris]MCJ8169625.1 ABC transporter permease subunit [Atopomonas sediminilitoris]
MNTPRDPASLPRLLISMVALLLLWPGLTLSEFNPGVWFAADNRATIAGFLADFWPLAHDADFLRLVARATLETLAMATAGTALAFLIGLPLALIVTQALSRRQFSGARTSAGSFIRAPLRLLLVILRSVPEIVWALLFVRAVGLGPTAGVLAIALSYGGMLGKVYAEIFESVDAKPARALLAAGSSRLQAFGYGVLPSAAPELVSYSVYRWECALRASVVMGIVGAGGLGQQVELSLRLFAGAEVASLLLAFVLLVALADGLSRLLRKALLT